jgi:hypothetical protein
VGVGEHRGHDLVDATIVIERRRVNPGQKGVRERDLGVGDPAIQMKLSMTAFR